MLYIYLLFIFNKLQYPRKNVPMVQIELKISPTQMLKLSPKIKHVQ